MKETIKRQIKKNIKKFYRQKKEKFFPGKSFVGISAPCYNEKEANRLIEELLKGRISMGPVARQFEKNFAKYIGINYAIAVNSGTSANMIAFDVLLQTGELRKGDEVIVPSATFSSVVSPIIQLGLKPLYVDVDDNSYNISFKEVQKAVSQKTKAIIIVHSLGQPAEMDALLRISRKNKLKIIEDCCEAHGASYKGRRTGSFGDLATFSFFVAHNITTGEGGMIVTNNEKYAKIARSLREFGRILDFAKKERFSFYDHNLKNYDKKYIFERIGYNMRMTDLSASLGIEQLKKMEKLNKKRKEITAFYKKNLQKFNHWLKLPEEFENINHSWYGFLLVIRKNAPFSRLDLVTFLEKNNIETRPFFAGCLPDQPAFRKSALKIVGKLPVAKLLRDNAFFIGCHPLISFSARRYVVDKIKEFLNKYHNKAL